MTIRPVLQIKSVEFKSAMTLKTRILFSFLIYNSLDFVLPCVEAQGAFTLENGKLAYCRDKDICPNKFVHAGSCKCNAPQVCCIDSGIARAKCKEYGQYVYTQDYGAALMVTQKKQNTSECHIEAVPLIVGGVKANPKEFPHMVAIGYGEKASITWMCGGTLISEKHILTAAHCQTSRDSGPAKWAKLGSLNIAESEETTQEYGIAEKIPFPLYKPPSRYHDIAIFKLDAAVTMTGHVRPACLNVEPDFSFKKALATGWGKLEYVAATGSNTLMKVTLNIIASTQCNDTFKVDVGGNAMTNGVIDSQMCAGELEGGKDTCQGDSGGPLQTVLADPYCMYSAIGVTSFGKFCGFKNAPAIYTRVSHYIPWIESIVWP